VDARSDLELIESFQRKDDVEALDCLFERHLLRVRNIIGPMVRNAADADDLTQQVFMRAARGLATFRGQSAFSTWLHRIALNTTYTFLSRRKSKTLLPLEIDLPEASHRNPDRDLMARDRLARVEAAMADLPPILRASLIMVVVEEIPVADVAASEDVTVATVHWRVHKARKLLQKSLGE